MAYSNSAQALENETTTHVARVASRFCGPPGSGNGGYTAGMLGKHLGCDVEVTLNRPVPLDQTMQVLTGGTDAARLLHGDEEVASARRAQLDLDVPESIGFSLAAAARVSFPGYRAHPFPSCFVCGTSRCCGDGLCLFTGIAGEGIVASSWVPAGEFVTGKGVIAPELSCAALDCPGAWALITRYGIRGAIVLGRMTYRLERPIYAGERYVVMGWALGRERRKSFCGTGVYDATGTVCAVAQSTWIQIG